MKYVRHNGDSKQKCPYCGKMWLWSSERHLEYFRTGTLRLKCKNCGETFTAAEKKER